MCTDAHLAGEGYCAEATVDASSEQVICVCNLALPLTRAILNCSHKVQYLLVYFSY
jgi:hypothetical protein